MELLPCRALAAQEEAAAILEYFPAAAVVVAAFKAKEELAELTELALQPQMAQTALAAAAAASTQAAATLDPMWRDQMAAHLHSLALQLFMAAAAAGRI